MLTKDDVLADNIYEEVEFHSLIDSEKGKVSAGLISGPNKNVLAHKNNSDKYVIPF